jgi:hypothetical protein
MRFVDYDPISGIETRFTYDHTSDQFTISHHQDTTAIQESNRLAQLDVESHRKQAKNDWSLYARVPNIVILEWRQKYGVDFYNQDHWPQVMRLINSPDYRDVKRTTYFHDR